MADNGSTQPPAEQVENLHLDEVTGEKVSKSELKRRQKQREKEAKKAAAASSKPAQPAKKSSTEADEKNLSPNQYFELRSLQIQKLRESKDPNPYPHKFQVDYDASKFQSEFGHLGSGETEKSHTLRIAGRIFGKRTAGAKLIFYDVRTLANRDGPSTKVQLLCQAQEVTTDGVPFEHQHEYLRRGDIIGIVGFPGRSAPKSKIEKGEAGELSIFATEVQLLAPCLQTLPDEYYGLKDHDQRFRNRPLDFIMNSDSVQAMLMRNRVCSYVRTYLEDRSFVEVETPMMNAIAGGATAKPFVTYHNELDMQMFMRIAPELYLKKLIVGGFEKVFEIGKNFRNEGIDLTHNPEFTTCEFYWAFADMYDLMDLTEEMVSGLVKQVTGGYKTKFVTQHGEVYEVNWEKPWRRVQMIPELERATGETFPPGEELHTEQTGEFLKGVLKKMNVECSPPLTNARMLDKLVGEFIESTCINPTFIMEHPELMSPLAKYSRSKPGLCERFEAFVCKKEICNAYTELNDPYVQRARFEEQARQKAAGDEEAVDVDESFINALEYALPPTAGWGMGIDRLSMFLTNKYSIREVIAFPFMKDEKPGKPTAHAQEVAGVESIPVEGVPHK